MTDKNKKILIIAGSVIGGFMLLCCGTCGIVSVFKVRDDRKIAENAQAKQEPKKNDASESKEEKKPSLVEKKKSSDWLDPEIEASNDVLTSKFLPHVAGNVKRYEEETYDPVTTRSLGYMKFSETYGRDGIVRFEGMMESTGIPPYKVTHQKEIRVRDGYVEIKATKLAQWTRMVKLGAKPGDNWSDGYQVGMYKFIQFDKQKAVGAKGPYELTQAVIEYHMSDTVRVIVLERDGGIQSEKSYYLGKNKKTLIQYKRLISSTYSD